MSNCGIKRIIRLKLAINTASITIFNDKNQDIANICNYSWSTDGVCWSSWTSYTEYLRITKRIETDFYLRILTSDIFTNILVNNCPMEYTVCIDSTTTFIQDFCNNTNIFQPYNNLDCALQLQQQLSDSVVCMFGIPIYYFRCDPKPETIDYTFKEYILHSVTSVKQLKLMINDGTMPSSNPKLTEFDFDWETDWETEISKTQFATAFGDNVIPKYGDFIYIPMMQRMWSVNSAYDEKNEGLMWRSTTWKLQLVKYNESTAYEQNDLDAFIDTLIPKTYENTFGEFEALEQERNTQIGQVSTPMFAATNLYDIFMEDSTRKQFTKDDVVIIDKQYNHRGNIISRTMYRFKNENGCITYQKGICGDSGTVMFLIETPGSFSGEISRDILQFGNLRVNVEYNKNENIFNIKCNSELTSKLEPFKSYACVIRWDRTNYIMCLDIYEYVYRDDIPVYKLRPEMYWFKFDEPYCHIVSNYDNDLYMVEQQPCQVHAYPMQITNIKYYNIYLDDETMIKESIKYTTNNIACVFNDTARNIISGHGYAIK